MTFNFVQPVFLFLFLDLVHSMLDSGYLEDHNSWNYGSVNIQLRFVPTLLLVIFPVHNSWHKKNLTSKVWYFLWACVSWARMRRGYVANIVRGWVSIVNSQVCSIQDFLPSKSLPILLPLKKTFVTPYFWCQNRHVWFKNQEVSVKNLHPMFCYKCS